MLLIINLKQRERFFQRLKINIIINTFDKQKAYSYIYINIFFALLL